MTKATPDKAIAAPGKNETTSNEPGKTIASELGGHGGVTDAANVAQTSPLHHDAGSLSEDEKALDKKTITEAPKTPLTSAAPPPGDDKKHAKRARLGDREIKNAAYEKHGHQMDSSECSAFLQGVRYAEEQHGVNKEV